MEAAIEVKEEEGYDIVPEIMIPLVGEKKELQLINPILPMRQANKDKKMRIFGLGICIFFFM